MTRPAHSHRRKQAESRAETKEQTRAALIDAAAALFGKEGFDGPSLDAICARAGYTRGAFYVHFASREELIVAVVETHRARVLESLLGAGGGAHLLADTVRRFADAVAAGVYPRGGAVQLHHFLDACARSSILRKRHVALLHDTQARLAAAARAGQSTRAVRSDVAPDHLALLLMTLVMGVEQLIDVGYDFDVRAGATAMLRLLAG
jgi:TetR/AcrR family transcriptional regulator, transcriptional repressor for nem operon